MLIRFNNKANANNKASNANNTSNASKDISLLDTTIRHKSKQCKQNL